MHESKLTPRIIRRHVRNNAQILNIYLTRIELDNTKNVRNREQTVTAKLNVPQIWFIIDLKI